MKTHQSIIVYTHTVELRPFKADIYDWHQFGFEIFILLEANFMIEIENLKKTINCHHTVFQDSYLKFQI